MTGSGHEYVHTPVNGRMDSELDNIGYQ